MKPQPDKTALKLYISLTQETFDDDHQLAEFLIAQYQELGKEEWCTLWPESVYLNFLLLENLKLKQFHNCECAR